MKKLITKLITPVSHSLWITDFTCMIPRFICGGLLTFGFGSDKFGMPWSDPSKNLSLFEVIDWFPIDVAEYGGLFAVAPVFLAWMGAASEAVGGLFLLLGLQTRIASFLIMCTMFVAIFFQQWDGSTWGMLPALGFLWVAIYNLTLGSGRFGLDYLLGKYLNKKWRLN